MSKTKLKPCPFCGEQSLFELYITISGKQIRCQMCGARGPDEHTKPIAIAAWNRRAKEKP